MTTSGGCRVAVACLEAVGGHANEHAASALTTMAVKVILLVSPVYARPALSRHQRQP